MFWKNTMMYKGRVMGLGLKLVWKKMLGGNDTEEATFESEDGLENRSSLSLEEVGLKIFQLFKPFFCFQRLGKERKGEWEKRGGVGNG